MNKYWVLFLLLIGSFSSSSFAAHRERDAVKDISRETFRKHLSPEEAIGEIHVNGNTYYVVAPPNINHPKTREGENDMPTSVPITPIITEPPGSSQNYMKDIEVAYASGSPYQGLYGLVASITWDGEDAYFPNIITNAPPLNTYVKASIKDGELVMPMNQTVKIFTGEELDEGEEEYAMNYGLLRPVFTLSDDNNIYIWYEYSSDYDSVSYIMGNDGSLKLQFQPAKYDYGEFEGKPNNPYLTVPPYAVGYYYNDDLTWRGWTGYCEWSQDYIPFNYPEVVVPSNLGWNTFSYKNSENIGVIVNVAETNDAIYIKGLSAYLSDVTFKADKISETRISVKPGQYIGKEYNLFYVITNTGVLEGKTVYPAPDGTPAEFILKRDTNGKIQSIEADPESPYFLVFDDDPGYFFDIDSFRGLVLTAQDSFAGTPSTPRDLEFAPYGDKVGANYIFFKLSPFANNGDIIDINNLYYTVFLNGDPYEFESSEGHNLLGKDVTMYNGLKESTYLVPYTFSNDVDLYEDNGGTFIVGLYAEGLDSVGVEAVYLCDGLATYSDLVTVDVSTGEVTTTPGSDAQVETIDIDDVISVEYFDFAGHRISDPTNGLFIKRYTLSDGSMKSRKVIVR